MNAVAWIVWGLVATLILTTIMALGQGLRLTRMSLPLLLGTMATPDRDRAPLYGFLVHLVNGWVFSFLYLAVFHAAGYVAPWFGALCGLLHGVIVLTVGLPMLPALHPRMASEHRGPTVVRVLEPPGFLGLNYGVRTPVSVLVAHVVFGLILGWFYEL